MPAFNPVSHPTPNARKPAPGNVTAVTKPPPHVEFLWWEECPSWERALADLRAAMAEVGLDPDSVTPRPIATEAAARREGFVGSPTIRIDRSDVSPPASDETPALTCRLYRLRDGRPSPTPDPADLRDALERAAADHEVVA